MNEWMGGRLSGMVDEADGGRHTGGFGYRPFSLVSVGIKQRNLMEPMTYSPKFDIWGLSRLRLCFGEQSLSIRFRCFIPTETRHTQRHPNPPVCLPPSAASTIPDRLRSSSRKENSFSRRETGRGQRIELNMRILVCARKLYTDIRFLTITLKCTQENPPPARRHPYVRFPGCSALFNRVQRTPSFSYSQLSHLSARLFIWFSNLALSLLAIP